jgi:TolA-binding protein
MKTCPQCQEIFADPELEECPNDGEVLVDKPDDLEESPALQEVLQVAPHDKTSMIDLEAMEVERQRIRAEKGLDDEDEEEEEEYDPDATGLIDYDKLKKKRRKRGLADYDDDEEEDDDEEDEEDAADGDDGESEEITDRRRRRAAAQEKTEIRRDKQGLFATAISRRPEELEAGNRRQKRQAAAAFAERRKARMVLMGILMGSLVIGASVALGLYYVLGLKSGANLTITTVPPGAAVLLDSKNVGTAPMQTRVKPGPHEILLRMDGYIDYRDVIDVPAAGLAFLQPLEKKEEAEPEKPAEDEGDDEEASIGKKADDLAARCRGLIKEGDLDQALVVFKEFVALAPDDPRANTCLEGITDARTAEKSKTLSPVGAAASGNKGRKKTAPKKDPAAQARDAHQEGQSLYGMGRLAEAKGAFLRAIRLKPGFAAPHRAVARIYHKENDKERARYHLQRYLDLGGPDPDFKVRRYLESLRE